MRVVRVVAAFVVASLLACASDETGPSITTDVDAVAPDGEAVADVPADPWTFDVPVSDADAGADAVVDPGTVDLPDAAEATAETLPDAAPGNLSCKEFYRQCVAKCPVGADGMPLPTCFEACHQTLSPEGAQVTDAFVACVTNSGCNLKPDDQAKLSCYAEECGDTYYACFHGDDDCAAVLKCAQACPQGEGNGKCVVACSQDGTVAAQQHLVKILKCIADNCCPTDAAACGTPTGQQCAKDVFQPTGACFQLGVQCMTGTY
jgi:hypothetical protein